MNAAASAEDRNSGANPFGAESGPAPNRHRMRIIGSEVKLLILEPAGDPSVSAEEGGIWRVSDLDEEPVFGAPRAAAPQEPDDQAEPEDKEENKEADD